MSSLCNGISISHSEGSSSSSLSSSVSVSEKEGEVAERVDTVDSESNPSVDMEHDSGTDHQEAAVANGKEDPTVENQAVDSPCSDITTTSLSATTESKHIEKEDSDTEMIDNAESIQKDGEDKQGSF